MPKRVVLLTTGQPSTNPRLVKEADLLAELGFDTHVIYCYWAQWAIHTDLEILQLKWWTATCVGGNPFHNKLLYYYTRIRKKLISLFPSFLKGNLYWLSLLNARASVELLHAANSHPADMYIAHNLGALYPAFKAAKRNHAVFAFDMEDYHPGEAMPTKGAEAEKRRREYLLGKLLPHCAYVSFAADGYEELTRKHITTDIQHPTVVYNTFPASEFIPPQPRSDACIRFIWFSQTLGRGRGLELFFEAIRQADVAYEITLIGQVNDRDFEALLRQDPHLMILPPMPQTQLHHLLSTYDIGLALELSAIDLNKNYALSNKLFAYLQAGLLVLATDTPAQQRFLQKYPEHHLLCAQNVESMRKAIQKLYTCLQHIRSTAQVRYQQAKAIAWENEQQKLIRIWEKVLR